MSFEKNMKPTPKLSISTGLTPKLSLVPNKPVMPSLAKPAMGLKLPPKPIGLSKVPSLPKKAEVVKDETVKPVLVKPVILVPSKPKPAAEPIVEKTTEEVNENNLEVAKETENAIPVVEELTKAIAAEEVIEDEKPVKRTRRTKQSKAVNSDKEVSDPKLESAPALAGAIKTLMEVNNIEIPESTCTMAVATGILFPVDISEMWQDGFYEQIEQRMSEIVITDDMNPSAVRVLLSKIDDLYSMVRLEHSRVKGIYESFNKGDSYIDRVKVLHAVGTNAEERRRASIIAAMRYGKAGQELNMYDISDGFRRQYVYLQGIIDQLDFKRQCLVTVGGTLRTESTL